MDSDSSVEENPDDERLNQKCTEKCVRSKKTSARAPKRRKLNSSTSPVVRKKRFLNKDERSKIVESIKSIQLDVIMEASKVELHKKAITEEETTIINNLLDDSNKNLFHSLVDHHVQTFITVYEQNNVGN